MFLSTLDCYDSENSHTWLIFALTQKKVERRDILGAVEMSCLVINILSFYEHVVEKLYIRSELILSTLKLPQLLQTK